MAKILDLKLGEKYGRLTVIRPAGVDKHNKSLWVCLCDCGETKIVGGGNLKKGNSKSCGCARIERVTKHGGSYNKSYNTWVGMMNRCHNPKDKAYLKYGAVGVRVCEKWHDYLSFASDMGEPKEGESLDRINPYGNYEKDNCRWANATIQSRNIRVRPNSKSGYTGVYEMKNGKWMAQITLNRVTVRSKIIATKEEAILARKELERIHWNGNQ